MIPLVTSRTTLSIADWSHKPTRVFLACFVLTLTFFQEISQKATHPKIAPSQARLIVEVLLNELPKRRCTLLI